MSGIFELLLARLNAQESKVNEWFDAAFAQTAPCFYSSVDLRHSGHKLVPVDTNLFPAGFNHLSPAARARAVKQIQGFIQAADRSIKKVLILPENHTRNLGYLDNLTALASLFTDAGLDAQIGSFAAEAGGPIELENSRGEPITEYPLVKEGNCLCTEAGFHPDLIVVNNDLTSGSPEILKGITQLIVPQIGQGWYRRKKSIHFEAYKQVSHQFATAFDFDPWLIHAQFHHCGQIDFKERKGVECVALGVEKVLRAVREKYQEHGIKGEPYAFIKADSGTYGMGIMTVRSGDEVYEMNKKSRNKMQVIKEGVQSSEVIIQEGIPTIDMVSGNRAEPMLYLLNGHPVGGAYRVNSERDQYGNLNAQGMYFAGMCDAVERDGASVKDCDFRVLGLIAQLATLAASREEYGEGWVI